jgi:hypothetical protein
VLMSHGAPEKNSFMGVGPSHQKSNLIELREENIVTSPRACKKEIRAGLVGKL